MMQFQRGVALAAIRRIRQRTFVWIFKHFACYVTISTNKGIIKSSIRKRRTVPLLTTELSPLSSLHTDSGVSSCALFFSDTFRLFLFVKLSKLKALSVVEHHLELSFCFLLRHSCGPRLSVSCG